MRMALYDVGKRHILRTLSDQTNRCLELLIRRIMRVWYAGRVYYCPCCGAQLRYLVSHRDLCPSCGSGRRHRLQWLYLSREHRFFEQDYTVLDISPVRHFQHFCLNRTNLKYVSIDLSMPWSMARADLTATPFPDETFRVILCSHVLEHIERDQAAMSEIYRLITRGGFALVQVPIEGKRTLEDPSVSDPLTRERLYGQKDHVRYYGMDITERLTRAGFKVEAIAYAQEFDETDQIRMALDREELLFVCHKQ